MIRPDGPYKVLFVDRDGTLLEEPSDFQIDSIEKFALKTGVVAALLRFREAGYRFVMVTNQDDLGTDANPRAAFNTIQNLLIGILRSQGIEFDEVLICPHGASERCLCRKPGIRLVQSYLADPELDRQRSMVVGDRATDAELAANMGIEGIVLGPELDWAKIAQMALSRPRTGTCRRQTKETEITVEVNLDGSGLATVSTGIGFFDHMLEQVIKHSGCDATVLTKGDAHIDDHHTVEDTALALGQAFRKALGDKTGIERFGFYLPMDDASAQVALDICGRSYCKFEGTFDRERIGEMATEMVPHFFRSFADGLQANIHIKITGQNTHHRIESAFKALGRSLRLAVAKSGLPGVPSTKGSL